MLCQDSGVHYKEQSSPYRSQRCSSCGWVYKKNRKGKVFHCVKCDYIDDADHNASINHEQELYELAHGLINHKLNSIGFYWLSNGIFDIKYEVLAVSHCPKS